MPKLAGKEYCTGCTACAAACPGGCIRMEPDENGFLYPKVEETACVDCGLCGKVCPVLSENRRESPAPEVWAAFSRNEKNRLASSSGGVFSELAQWVMTQGGAVFGAAYDGTFGVIHRPAENADDLARFRGAKYAQSDLGDTFRQVKTRLDRGQKVLFSGTPCQVAGLKAYLGKDEENLITVDVVCHSVPSPRAWQAYVRHRAIQDNRGELPSAINLRAKETGWSRYSYCARYEYEDGFVRTETSGQSLYMRLFVGGFLSRESCANCAFKGSADPADLTLGDFWGIWNVCPEMDDNKGTSLVVVRSARGKELLRQISDKLLLKSVSLEDASRENPALCRSTRPNGNREIALELIRRGDFRQLEEMFSQSGGKAQGAEPGLVHRILKKLGLRKD